MATGDHFAWPALSGRGRKPVPGFGRSIAQKQRWNQLVHDLAVSEAGYRQYTAEITWTPLGEALRITT
jgi:hypothetical protein